MRLLILTSILLLNLFGASASADKDEAVTSVEPLVRGNRSRRLVGSKRTLIELFPYYVSLGYEGKYVCGGAIISRYSVLTAASCQVRNISQLLVHAGTIWRLRGSLHHVYKFVPHPNFTEPSYANDIALLTVMGPFEIDYNHDIVEMFQQGQKMLPDSVLDFVGFHKLSKQLQHIGLTTMPCKKNNDHLAQPPGTFCAGYTNNNICVEDKGLPVTVNCRLVGIVSHETNCKDGPGVITNVAFFRDWITSISNI